MCVVETSYTRDTSMAGHESMPDGLSVCDHNRDWLCDWLWVWEGDSDWPSSHRDGVCK